MLENFVSMKMVRPYIKIDQLISRKKKGLIVFFVNMCSQKNKKYKFLSPPLDMSDNLHPYFWELFWLQQFVFKMWKLRLSHPRLILKVCLFVFRLEAKVTRLSLSLIQDYFYKLSSHFLRILLFTSGSVKFTRSRLRMIIW